MKRTTLHRRLAAYFARLSVDQLHPSLRNAEELVVQLRRSGQQDELGRCLASIPIFDTLFRGATRVLVLESWAALSSTADPVAMYAEGLDAFETQHGADSDVLGRLAAFYDATDRFAAAAELQRRRLALGIDSGDRALEAHARVALGALLQSIGDYPAAIETLDRAYAMYQELDDDAGLAATAGALGRVKTFTGEHQQAYVFLQEQLRRCAQMHDQTGVATAAANTGLLFLGMGRRDEAMEQFVRAEQIMSRSGNVMELATIGINIGNLHFARREYRQALERYERSRTLSTQLGDRRGIALALGGMGVVYRDIGELDRAVEHLAEVERISLDIGDRHGAAIAVGNMGHLHLARSDFRAALECYERAAAEHRAIGFLHGLAIWLSGSAGALVELAEQRPEDASLRHRARQCATEGLALAEEHAPRAVQLRCSLLLARLDAADGNTDEARSRLRRRLDSATDPVEAGLVHYWLSKLALEPEIDHRSTAERHFLDVLSRGPHPEAQRRLEDLRAQQR